MRGRCRQEIFTPIPFLTDDKYQQEEHRHKDGAQVDHIIIDPFETGNGKGRGMITMDGFLSLFMTLRASELDLHRRAEQAADEAAGETAGGDQERQRQVAGAGNERPRTEGDHRRAGS